MVQAALLNPRDVWRLQRIAVLGAGAASLYGIVVARNDTVMFAYLLILGVVLIPIFIWLRKGGLGLPILPVVGALYAVYYALPVLKVNLTFYRADEVVSSGLTVVAFFAAATIGWWYLAFRPIVKAKPERLRAVSDDNIPLFVVSSLWSGMLFQIFMHEGWLYWVGPFFAFYGTFRAIAASATSAGFFLYGYAVGRNIPDQRARFWASFAIVVNILLALETLYLFEAAGLIMVAVVGYLISAKRIPWVILIGTLAITVLLSEAKLEMRQRYWNTVPPLTVLDAPQVILEWVDAGIGRIASGGGNSPSDASLTKRLDLFKMVVLVERMTPSHVPYLNGRTYALLPLIVLPRFLVNDKLESQIGLKIMSVRYGLQSLTDTSSTIITWGLITEAFANFGYYGVVGTGLIFGLIAGLFSGISIGSSALSLSNLFSISALSVMINTDYDFSYLMLNLGQALVAVWCFYVLLQFFAGKKMLSQRIRPDSPTSLPAE